MAGVRMSVHMSSRMERPRNPQINRMEAHNTGNPGTYLEVKRPINAVTDNAPYAVEGITIFLKLACLSGENS